MIPATIYSCIYIIGKVPTCELKKLATVSSSGNHIKIYLFSVTAVSCNYLKPKPRNGRRFCTNVGLVLVHTKTQRIQTTRLCFRGVHRRETPDGPPGHPAGHQAPQRQVPLPPADGDGRGGRQEAHPQDSALHIPLPRAHIQAVPLRAARRQAPPPPAHHQALPPQPAFAPSPPRRRGGDRAAQRRTAFAAPPLGPQDTGGAQFLQPARGRPGFLFWRALVHS